jgi:hypothetical protein
MHISSWLDSSCSIPNSTENRIAFPDSAIKAKVSTELLHREEVKSNYKELFFSLRNELDNEKLLQIGYTNIKDYCEKLKHLCLHYPGKDYMRPYVKIEWIALNQILADWRENSDKDPVFILHPGNFIMKPNADNPAIIEIELKFTLLT